MKEESFPYQQEFTDYLEIERGLSDGTVEGYRRDLNIFTQLMVREFFPQGMILDQLETKHVRRFLVYLKKERSNDAGTRNRKLASLRSYFSFLEIQGYVESNPVQQLKNVKTAKLLPVFLTKDESDRLINAARMHNKPPYRDYAMMRVLLQTGCRLDEMVSLNLDSLNLEDRYMRIIGKGNKERMIPLTDKTCAALAEYLAGRLPEDKNEQAVFLNQRGRRISHRGVQLIFNQTCKEAGLNKERLTVHKLRHTCFTMLLNAGVDLPTIKDIAGHENISSTEIYVHVTQREIRSAMAKHPLG
ncbi:tyrosine-type recombinase/integrase [Dethiobacter alkaliphilus]|uniref:Integrase family protein n=1 Tax=Dethiobacter alkaliphilus AHT 1 TaxID=555088 RepID=C0GGM8_DETAL|nr:tyrosine-type recombinase/integrase [Dethiobacter alkaliphilus]EEG77469.1 integrase family protein [Dethiobacter alkaliphilus AHT 1]